MTAVANIYGKFQLLNISGKAYYVTRRVTRCQAETPKSYPMESGSIFCSRLQYSPKYSSTVQWQRCNFKVSKR